MKFGIFYEHQLPRPWDAHSGYRLFHESLEQIETTPDSTGPGPFRLVPRDRLDAPTRLA